MYHFTYIDVEIITSDSKSEELPELQLPGTSSTGIAYIFLSACSKLNVNLPYNFML